MEVLKKVEDFIKSFNKNNQTDFSIDTIRIEFSKQHKLENLKSVGNWKKINSNDKKILAKLKKRLADDEVTSAYQLENYNIYYYNSNKDKPKYRKAIMVIFGMKQYHKKPPPHQTVSKIISILRNVSSIDLCYDMKNKSNVENLKQFFDIREYLSSYYINKTDILMMDRVIIYNKTIKNNLNFNVWRIEATITIPNIKYLVLPLEDFKNIIDLARSNNN